MNLPHSIDVEKALLGSMLQNKKAMSIGIEQLEVYDFYDEANGLVFSAIFELARKSDSLDVTMVRDYLQNKGTLLRVGGVEYLIHLTEAGLRPYNALSYIQSIKEKSVRRKLIAAASEISAISKDTTKDVDVLGEAERRIFDLADETTHKGLVHVGNELTEMMDHLEEAGNNPEIMRGVSTGFVELDLKTNGLHKGELVLVAARPSMGKSALAMNIAQHAALHEKRNVCVFSLEMGRPSLLYRVLASEYLISLSNILSAKLTGEDWKKLSRGVGALSTAPLYIDDTSGISVMQIRSKLRRHRLEFGEVDLVVVDYLQLMDGGGGENRQVEISSISRGLKSLAKEFNCPVLALSQLSRGPETRTNKRPLLSDLRESGAIEQDADVVMFIYREDYYNKETELKNISEIIIAKQRNGETGTVQLAWLGQHTKFADLHRE
ncbi:MAG: replicative DNA helicase [Tissierellia bacterium]|jgi:replicative DNA helicase|nr:replicative DNA helicase [Tissierellia bacterium]